MMCIKVIKWFAERADMIIIMFDAHKLDISDELKSVLDVLKPHQDKVRVLLNKADTIDAQVVEVEDEEDTTTHYNNHPLQHVLLIMCIHHYIPPRIFVSDPLASYKNSSS